MFDSFNLLLPQTARNLPSSLNQPLQHYLKWNETSLYFSSIMCFVPYIPWAESGKETRDGGISSGRTVCPRSPGDQHSPDRRGAAAPVAHKDAQCLSLPVLCQNAFPPEKCVSPGRDGEMTTSTRIYPEIIPKNMLWYECYPVRKKEFNKLLEMLIYIIAQFGHFT